LLIAAGLWIRSSMNASALAEAMQQQQWDEVLAIDGQNVTALVGRANQRLNAGTPDIEGAFADIGLAEQVDSTVAVIKPAKALAHAKRATSLATDGKIVDAEKDLKKAERLGASDSALTTVRQLLAAGYLKKAEDGVARGDVAGIRSDCDAAERYQADDSDVSRLRASAFKAEGEQKEKSGDLSGALAAFDGALKLNSRLGLKTERAVLHVKLGEQAVAKQDYVAAATELDSAMSLDQSATGVVALVGSVADPVVVAFEQAPTVENQTAALAVLSSIQSVDAQNEELPVLSKRVTAAVLKRGESVAGNDPDSALKDYETALSRGASASESASLKGQLVTALTARCRQSLGGQDVAKVTADLGALQQLDSQAGSSLIADFEKLPVGVLSQIPVSVLSQLSVSVLSRLPASSWPATKNTIGMQFKLLPGGTFTMGESSGNAHQVTLTKAFELGVYELTQEEYERVMGTNPSDYKGPQNAVENVSWDDAVEFCRKLSAMPAEQSAGYLYRLPTEAEWEYACRAGTTTEYSFGDSDSRLGDYAWNNKNSGDTAHPVGGKKPNPWGLYDMYGNVYEWCQDWYGDYPSGSLTDPTGASSGSHRVARGGSWLTLSDGYRSASRNWYTSASRYRNLGFRVLRSSIK
jgi:formylglycine-generating enzyme required for sulfatase activity